jgi:serine/threonine-protein kinase
MVLMEFVDAHTLESHQCQTMLQFCELAKQVAAGLGAMHSKGYVHADIKPNNILVTDTASVKIIDFGQSCETGTVKERIQGTPDYIAPEQVRREPITPATDVFNFGATMYFVLTGKYIPTLIPKGQPGQIVTDNHGHAGRFPAPDQVDANIPSALSKLVMESVQADPAARPKTMKSVADRLAMASVQLERRDDVPLRGTG